MVTVTVLERKSRKQLARAYAVREFTWVPGQPRRFVIYGYTPDLDFKAQALERRRWLRLAPPVSPLP